jgi:hypothetical protein
LDVDGTLVDDQKQIPPQNLEALRAAKARGVEVAIASGRMVPSIEIMEGRLGLDCALIAYNGGRVVSTRADGRRTIAHRPLPVAISDLVLDHARRSGHPLNFYLDDRLFCDRSRAGHPLTEIYRGRTGSVYEFIDIETIRGRPSTKLILLSEPQEQQGLYDHFRVRLAGQANVVRTDPEYLEFMALGVDKATALPDLAAYYGIAVEEILAIGDADNDRLMLQVAGVGVAVANARPAILAEARYRTRRTNNEGAVAEAIARWVL